jgi:hypothetical protein
MYDEQKPREHELAPELVALERRLLGMTPAAPRIDRDRMMFAAGQAAGAGQDGTATFDRADRSLYLAGASWAGRFWPAATFTMAAATLLLASILVWQNRWQPMTQQPAPIEPTVIANNNSHDLNADEPARSGARNTWQSIPSVNSGYLGVRYVALTRGVGALSLQ